MIPERLKTDKFRFLRLDGDKKPLPGDGADISQRRFDDEELQKHLSSVGNYGVIAEHGNLLIVDCDLEIIYPDIAKKFGKTFTVKSPKGYHLYYISNRFKNYSIKDDKGDELLSLRGHNSYIVGAGSVRNDGGKYVVLEDIDFAYVNYDELKKYVDKRYKPQREETKKEKTAKSNDPIWDRINSEVTIPMVLAHYGVRTVGKRAKCPVHGGDKQKSFSFDTYQAKCFQCCPEGEGWNAISLVKTLENTDDLESVRKILCQIGGIKHEENTVQGEQAETMWRQLAIDFHNRQEYFYDKKMWWLWDFSTYNWKRVEEVRLMNAFDSHFFRETENSTIKNNLIEALKKIGDRNIPKPIKDTWIQFRDKIVDIENWQRFEATPEYFVTNPIPWKLGTSTETPTIDRLFAEWVIVGNQDASYVDTLKEIAAYCMLPGYPFHRVFAFIGSGSNGKSKYVEFIMRLVGKDNCCSSNIDKLVKNRFASSTLYRKLVCTLSEIDGGIFSKTGLIKQLTGEDMVNFEFKHKDSFDDWNYAKMLISTNTLPETTDKTDGFYRRWSIVDFPNKFPDGDCILKTIPDEEYSNFAYKSLATLKRLLDRRTFTNQGDISNRKQRYEQRSNSIDRFIEEYTVKDANAYILFGDFYERYKEYLSAGKFRMKSQIEVGKELSEREYEGKRTTVQGQTSRLRTGFRWKHDSSEERGIESLLKK